MRLIEELREMSVRRHKLVAELQELDATFEELRALVNGGLPTESVREKREGKASEQTSARRDRIVSVLGDRMLRASEIAHETGVQSATVYQDLVVLVTKGRVEKTSDGYRVVGGSSLEGVRDAATPVPFPTESAAKEPLAIPN